ncbi:hypothetical protein CIL05_09115 [Virgibacillus profundi]|uniref:RNA polymerase subunit sigma n=1 Tax=Virgibacillus profundi TaxID=2024555 RepID=A0A2A2IFE5_9BACI|nr:hypothetical protein [Virgibacillus profundi]PAV30026.1 hypothetical protein CIL05_09115 [Virgibacillus profundi]PXY54199.1 hypothetical protein CIT14_09200 [Virgibacillus profundi]
MGWKSIEMQVALPRTQDAGKLQDQMQKQSQQFQGSLAQSQLKQEELKRKRINESDHINDGVKIKKERDNDSNDNDQEQEKSQQLNKKTNHPYLGSRLDLNG